MVKVPESLPDMIGQEIRVGDLVAYNPPRYAGVYYGKVESLTPKMVEVKHKSFGNLRRRSVEVIKLNPDQEVLVAMKRMGN